MKDRENRRRSKNRFTLLSLPLAHVYMCSMFPQWDAAFCCLRRRRIYFIESGHQACMHVYFIIIIFSFFMPFSSRFPRHIHPDSLVHSPSLSLSPCACCYSFYFPSSSPRSFFFSLHFLLDFILWFIGKHFCSPIATSIGCQLSVHIHRVSSFACLLPSIIIIQSESAYSTLLWHSIRRRSTIT